MRLLVGVPSLAHGPTYRKPVAAPASDEKQTRVVDSRHTATGIRRRRECESCDYRFTTYELTGSPSARVTTEYTG
jgi:transcriptional regulator NrdR family protein